VVLPTPRRRGAKRRVPPVTCRALAVRPTRARVASRGGRAQTVAGEGSVGCGPRGSGGAPAIFTTFERPDPQHPSVVAGVARIDSRGTRLQLVAGTTQPDRTGWPERAQVPVDARAGLVATFNSGFKMIDANGGFYADGRTAKALWPGAASVVIRADGSATVGEWGRDATLTPDVVAVRQNLELVVDEGRLVAALADNIGGR
jgi:hypothetical protein